MRFLAWLPMVLAALPASAQTSLPAGPYGVGFRALYEKDAGRAYDSEYFISSAAAVKKPRPVFIAIWYPATSG